MREGIRELDWETSNFLPRLVVSDRTPVTNWIRMGPLGSWTPGVYLLIRPMQEGIASRTFTAEPEKSSRYGTVRPFAVRVEPEGLDSVTKQGPVWEVATLAPSVSSLKLSGDQRRTSAEAARQRSSQTVDGEHSDSDCAQQSVRSKKRTVLDACQWPLAHRTAQGLPSGCSAASYPNSDPGELLKRRVHTIYSCDASSCSLKSGVRTTLANDPGDCSSPCSTGP
jgi:hypothetical protein